MSMQSQEMIIKGENNRLNYYLLLIVACMDPEWKEGCSTFYPVVYQLFLICIFFSVDEDKLRKRQKRKKISQEIQLQVFI